MGLTIVTSAREIEQRVSTYSNLSMGLLVVGCIFLILAIMLFIIFRVGNIIAVKTGKAAMRTIKEMEEANANTGRMNMYGRGTKGEKSERKQLWNTGPLSSVEQATQTQEGANETSLLSAELHTSAIVIGGNETTVLNEGIWNDYATSNLDEDVMIELGKFVIMRDITLIHTDEML